MVCNPFLFSTGTFARSAGEVSELEYSCRVKVPSSSVCTLEPLQHMKRGEEEWRSEGVCCVVEKTSGTIASLQQHISPLVLLHSILHLFFQFKSKASRGWWLTADQTREQQHGDCRSAERDLPKNTWLQMSLRSPGTGRGFRLSLWCTSCGETATKSVIGVKVWPPTRQHFDWSAIIFGTWGNISCILELPPWYYPARLLQILPKNYILVAYLKVLQATFVTEVFSHCFSHELSKHTIAKHCKWCWWTMATNRL